MPGIWRADVALINAAAPVYTHLVDTPDGTYLQVPGGECSRADTDEKAADCAEAARGEESAAVEEAGDTAERAGYDAAGEPAAGPKTYAYKPIGGPEVQVQAFETWDLEQKALEEKAAREQAADVAEVVAGANALQALDDPGTSRTEAVEQEADDTDVREGGDVAGSQPPAPTPTCPRRSTSPAPAERRRTASSRPSPRRRTRSACGER